MGWHRSTHSPHSFNRFRIAISATVAHLTVLQFQWSYSEAGEF
jgi:hypothetical protein